MLALVLVLFDRLGIPAQKCAYEQPRTVRAQRGMRTTWDLCFGRTWRAQRPVALHP